MAGFIFPRYASRRSRLNACCMIRRWWRCSSKSISITPRSKNAPINGSHPSLFENARSRFASTVSSPAGPITCTQHPPTVFTQNTVPNCSWYRRAWRRPSLRNSIVCPMTGNPGSPITGWSGLPAGGAASGRVPLDGAALDERRDNAAQLQLDRRAHRSRRVGRSRARRSVIGSPGSRSVAAVGSEVLLERNDHVAPGRLRP